MDEVTGTDGDAEPRSGPFLRRAVLDHREQVRQQALAGRRNRGVAATLERLWTPTGASTGAPGGLVGEYFCTCGRPDCDEILVLTLEEYRFVRERPYRFVVAPGHATEVDEVVHRADEYDVVEVAEAYRVLVPHADA